jgi:hypothetical protein
MPTIETILSRAMNDPTFADALFADPEKALAEYDLPAEVIAQFKNLSRAQFEAWEAEDRRSMSVRRGKEDNVLLRLNGIALPAIATGTLPKLP